MFTEEHLAEPRRNETCKNLRSVFLSAVRVSLLFTSVGHNCWEWEHCEALIIKKTLNPHFHFAFLSPPEREVSSDELWEILISEA